MSLPENIKAQRQRLHLSQEYVAEQIGLSRQAVSKWETGQSAPSSSNLAELAALFDISISELIEPEKFRSIKQAEHDRTAEAYRNRKMLRSRFYGYMALWVGYQCFRYSSNVGDGTWMKVWGLLIFLTGFVFVLISSLDYNKREKYCSGQVIAGALFLFACFAVPELLPLSYGLDRLASAAICGLCLFYLCERFWKHVWPYDVTGGRDTVK